MAWLRSSARGRVTAGGWLPSRPSGTSPPELPQARDEEVPERRRAARGRGRARERRDRPWARLRGFARLPATLSGARWQPGRSAVLGVLVVVVLAVLVLGLRVARAGSGHGDVVAPGSRDGPVGVSAGAVSVGVPQGGPSAGASDPGVGASPTPSVGASGSAVLVVHVVGRVRHPGVLRLPVGSRVADAVAAAGGASPGADVAALNLARLLVDGEQVRVPAPGEVVPRPGGGVAASGGAGGPGGSGDPAGGGQISLSTADVATLDTLPGIGPVLAQRIVDWRTANGRFTSVDELGEVSGIGEKLLAQVRPLVVP